jgi:hypothetical protein
LVLVLGSHNCYEAYTHTANTCNKLVGYLHCKEFIEKINGLMLLGPFRLHEKKHVYGSTEYGNNPARVAWEAFSAIPIKIFKGRS